MHIIPWWGWTILAAMLALAELHAPGSYLIWIALGAALTAVADAAWELSISAQVGVFTGATVLSCLGGYFVYRKAITDGHNDTSPLNQRNISMVGARGVVSEQFQNGRGKVRLGDSVWLAEGPDLAEGTPVIVSSVMGTRVFVEAARAKPPG